MSGRRHKPVVAPTITAYDTHEYRMQVQQVEHFAKRLHIDLMDGEFAPTQSPALDHIWWPHGIMADIHLMYQRPMDVIDQLLKLKPHMVVVHNEAEVHHMHFAAKLHEYDIKVGLAVLAETPIEHIKQVMHSFDQVLIFSGKLGHHGGKADMDLLEKVKYVREHYKDAEIAWDGGISAENARQLVKAGVNVLNTGGYIQKSDNPQKAYDTIKRALKK